MFKKKKISLPTPKKTYLIQIDRHLSPVYGFQTDNEDVAYDFTSILKFVNNGCCVRVHEHIGDKYIRTLVFGEENDYSLPPKKKKPMSSDDYANKILQELGINPNKRKKNIFHMESDDFVKSEWIAETVVSASCTAR